jgi:MFS family permease
MSESGVQGGTDISGIGNQEAVQRRTVGTLMIGQALGTAAVASMAAALGLLAAGVLGSDSLAGLPAAVGTLGTAVIASPLAGLAAQKGRRPALWTGYCLGALGATTAAVAGQVGVFWLLLIGMAIFGGGQAAGLQSRFAAADLAAPAHRARDISRVVWVATIGGVLGPVLNSSEDRLGRSLGLGPWVGPMVAAFLLYGAAAAWAALRLRPDPLLMLSERAGLPPTDRPRRQLTAAWRAVRAEPMALLAIAALAVSHSAMVAVMTMTPLHMRDHGQAGLSGVVIAVHILGMFGFSPLVGRYADRMGAARSIRDGALVLAAGVVSSVVAGYQPSLIFVGLFLLGLGWSFGLIGGSALLTASVPESSRVAAQGLSDTLLSGLAAVAALSSGLIKQGWGFHWLANLAAGCAVALALVAMVVSRNQAITRTMNPV